MSENKSKQFCFSAKSLLHKTFLFEPRKHLPKSMAAEEAQHNYNCSFKYKG